MKGENRNSIADKRLTGSLQERVEISHWDGHGLCEAWWDK